jgi:hypothetical protein
MSEDTKKQILIGIASSMVAGLILYYLLKDKKAVL